MSEARKAYALRLLVDLQGQLARGREDQAGREVVVAVVVGERRRAGAVAKHGDDDGEEEPRRLAGACDESVESKRTCLRAGHQVAALAADGEAVFLHGGGTAVVAADDIIEKRFGNVFLRKLGDGLGDVVTIHFDWDVVVLHVRERERFRAYVIKVYSFRYVLHGLE